MPASARKKAVEKTEKKNARGGLTPAQVAECRRIAGEEFDRKFATAKPAMMNEIVGRIVNASKRITSDFMVRCLRVGLDVENAREKREAQEAMAGAGKRAK